MNPLKFRPPVRDDLKRIGLRHAAAPSVRSFRVPAWVSDDGIVGVWVGVA